MLWLGGEEERVDFISLYYLLAEARGGRSADRTPAAASGPELSGTSNPQVVFSRRGAQFGPCVVF